MIAMDKVEIAKYLRDYAIMSELIRSYPNVKIGTLYRNYMVTNGRIDEYNDNSFVKMVRVYAFMTEVRIFSFIEEIAINYLIENDLDFDDIISKIFVNSKDAKSFSKKEIIAWIRKAFNHNDSDAHSKYNISVNGRYMEVDLLDARKPEEIKNNPQKRRPFHIKIDGRQLQRIREEALRKNHNLLVGNVDDSNFDYNNPFDEKNVDDLEFVRMYFSSKKIGFPIIDEIWKSGIIDMDTFQGKMNLLISILNANNYTGFHVSRFPLSDEQKKKLKKLLKGASKMNLNRVDRKMLLNVINHFFCDVIPLGMFHFDQFCYEQQFASWFMDYNLSFGEIEDIIKRGLMGNSYANDKPMSEEYVVFDRERYEMLLELSKEHSVNELMFQRDYYSRVQYPIALYLGYISDSLNDEVEIEVDGVKYEAVHIRDAFVHGRWFFGEDDKIELYDCKSGNNNDYNFYWHASINLHKLLKVMDDIYNKQQAKKIKK